MACTKAWRHERECHIGGNSDKFRVDGEVWVSKGIFVPRYGVILGCKKDVAILLGTYFCVLVEERNKLGVN